MKIKTLLTVFFIEVSIIPIAFIIGFSYYTYTNYFTAAVQAKLQTLAEEKKFELLQYLEGKKSTTLSLADGAVITAETERLSRITNPATLKEEGGVLFENLTKNKMPYDKDILEIHAMNLDGMILVGTDSDDYGSYKEKDQPYFINGKTGVYIQDARQYSIGDINYTVFTIGAPVRSHVTGEIVGVVGVLYKFDSLQNVLGNYMEIETKSSIGTTTTLDVALVNSKYNPIYPPRFMKAFTPFVTEIKTDATQACFQNHENHNGSWLDYRGVQIIGSAVCIAIEKDFSWTLVVKQDKNELMAPINDLFRNLLVVVGAIIILVLVFSVYITNLLNSAFSGLINVTNEIKEGNLDVRVPQEILVRKDELGILAGAFQGMLIRIHEAYSSMDAKVREKTVQVEEQIHDLVESQKSLAGAFQNLKEEKIKSDIARVKDEAILSSIGEGLVVVDTEERITFINNQAARAFKVDKEAVLGRKYPEVFILVENKTKIVPHEERPLTVALKNGSRFVTEPNKLYSYYRSDGTMFPIQGTVAPIIRDWNIDGAAIVFRDVTEELEIDETKNEFINLASHQLRTPITAINWYAEMLLDESIGKLNDEQKSYAFEIQQSGRRIIDLVSVFLDVSRMELGIFNIQAKPVDISAVVQDLLREIKVHIEEKKLSVKTYFETDLPLCETDDRLVRVIVDNLVSNAIQYTGTGGEISVSVKKSTNSVMIGVHDNGIGISPEDSSHIFTKFFRSDTARNVKPDGNGLGLYIIKKIIEEIGGKISFESIAGHGTTFYAVIPEHIPEKKGK
jgi:PAS domain S-box-containing protein